MFNLGNTSGYATVESSQHGFLSMQMEKNFLQKQNVSEIYYIKNVSPTNVSFVPKWGNIEGNMFPQQCFLICRVL